jgi:hypothetical protein
MAEYINTFLTLVLVLITFLVWKTYYRIEWLTGAMESHSNLMLRIEARRGIKGEPIELLWWDPTIEPVPTEKRHGQEIDLSTIYIYLPPELRWIKETPRQKLKKLFSLP